MIDLDGVVTRMPWRIVIWSLGVSGLDAILITIGMVLIAIGVRNLMPLLSGRRD